MKPLFLFVTFFITTFIHSQIVNIPDVNFKNALINDPVADLDGNGIFNQIVDANSDGEIQLSEALAVFGLDISQYNISTLDGIQSFANLEVLYSEGNQLTEIDFSQNALLRELWLTNNGLTSLNVSENYNLEFLSSHDNELTSLDISQLLNLRILRTSLNLIEELDISNNLALEQLWCSSNLITSIDISNNSSIINLSVGNNQLTYLNIQNGNNKNITRMWAHNNPELECILVDDQTFPFPDCNLQGNNGWCKDPDAIYVDNMTECNLSNETFDRNSTYIYPNPVDAFFEVTSNEPVNKVSVFSQIGNLLIETDNKRVDMSNLSDGIYFVKISLTGSKIAYYKIIKKIK